jgi:CHAT domain-containing protein/Tfp pilus assembly protein PilF
MRFGTAGRLVIVVAGVVAGLLTGGSAPAQAYARFAVPDSSLSGAIRVSGAQFESAWNALLVTELRASLARADSAARLLALARRVAEGEKSALGTRNAADALRLRAGWPPALRRLRIAGAVDESLGAVAQGARDFARADSLFGAALRGYQRLGESRRIAWVWGSLASVAFMNGDMTASDSLYRQALAARRAIGDLRLVGNALNTLGSVAYNRRRLDEALRFYGEARAVREQTGERAALGTTLNNLGNVAAAMGRSDSAAVFFRAALDLTVAQGDSVRAYDVLNNYGVLLGQGDDPTAALPYFERAIVIARQRGDPGLQAQCLINIGGLLGQAGHFADALARLDAARELAIRANDVRKLREVLINSGRIWIGLGDPSGAYPPLERALALADSLGDERWRAEALSNLGVAARLADDLSGAARFAMRTITAATTAGDSLLVHDAATTMGEVAFESGAFEQAHRWFSRAHEAGTLEAAVRVRDVLNLGAAEARLDRLEEADRRFLHALALSDSIASDELIWPALQGRGDVAERRGDHVGALAFNRQAIGRIEGLRAQQGSEQPSIRLLARRMFAFEELIHLLTRLDAQYPDSGFAAEAFHWSERARSRSFLDLVTASGGGGRPARPLTLVEAQGLLTSDKDALLVYSMGDSTTSLWIVMQRSWKLLTLPGRRAIRSRVEILRRSLANAQTADGGAVRVSARSLYRALIEPALPALRGADHLIIAADDILALVPFEALLAADPSRDARPPRGAYLVERYAISYTPSASALSARPGAVGVRRGNGIVALGDPSFGRDPAGGIVAGAAPGGAIAQAGGLAALPHTADELAALSTLAGRRPLAILTGRDATRDRLLTLPELPQAALIHIATHGESNEVEPERSGLWLAAAEKDSTPGFVSVLDILGLRLDAGLVTLSACETGLGRLERGEGVIGLTRAFLAAGASNVMVSLWKVNDRSTALLMEEFYRRFLGEGSGSAVALARAKRTLLARPGTASPFYWAPFVLVGSGGPLGGRAGTVR